MSSRCFRPSCSSHRTKRRAPKSWGPGPPPGRRRCYNQRRVRRTRERMRVFWSWLALSSREVTSRARFGNDFATMTGAPAAGPRQIAGGGLLVDVGIDFVRPAGRDLRLLPLDARPFGEVVGNGGSVLGSLGLRL